jgi:pimeloyl-ACP methyl ester carboxylesterase
VCSVSEAVSLHPGHVADKMNSLEVPLDYSKLVAGDVFKLALVKVPAKTTVPYGGTLFLMQGLQSNVDFATTPIDATDVLANLFQSGGLEGYDVISWDMRGVGHSTPQIQCFPDAAAQESYAEVERNGLQLNAFNGSHPPTLSNIMFNIQQVSAHQQTFYPGCNQYYGHYLP